MLRPSGFRRRESDLGGIRNLLRHLRAGRNTDACVSRVIVPSCRAAEYDIPGGLDRATDVAMTLPCIIRLMPRHRWDSSPHRRGMRHTSRHQRVIVIGAALAASTLKMEKAASHDHHEEYQRQRHNKMVSAISFGVF